MARRSRTHISIADHFSVLSEVTRLRILDCLAREELTVGEIATVLQLPQSTVSRHLKVLFERSWVKRHSAGTASRYYLRQEDLPEEVVSVWEIARGSLAETAQSRQDRSRLSELLSRRQESESLAYFGRIGGQWDEVRAQLFGANVDEQALLSLIPSEWTIADLGCGTGNLAARLAPFVSRIHAVDLSRAMLSAARKRLAEFRNVTFHQADLTELPLGASSVDAVTISLVLHHVAEPGRALKEGGRILKKGGRLLIVDMLEHDREKYRQTMGHKWLGFAPAQIEQWCREAGLGGVRLWRLPSNPEARGPDLFAALARKGG